MRRRLLTFTLFVLALAPATTSAAAAQADGAAAGSGPASTPEVEMLDRGASPRTDLRYAVPAGTTETLRMRTYARLSQTVDGETRTGSTPNITFAIDATVDAVGADGALTVMYEYASIEVSDSGPEAVAETTRQSLEPLIGATGVLVMTDKGALVSNQVSIPPGLEPEIEQLFDQLQSQATSLSVPFPDGKVGEGARWRASTELELGGIELRQTATYTLERDGNDRTTLAVEVRQTAPRQQVTPPGSDDSFLLLSSRATGSGETVTAPATSVLPVGGRSDVRTRQRLEIDGERISQTTSISLFLNEDR
jgi:hypothetical protein